MRVVSVDEGCEKTFWDYVNRDLLDYYFFIFDMRLNRGKTEVFMAVDDRVRGLMLVYADYVVQLRGDREAVRLLLDGLRLEQVELQAPLDCEDLILAKFEPKAREEMALMSVRKGEESIQMMVVPERLGANDAEQVADLMRRADPSWWGAVTAERIKSRTGDEFWLSIKQDGRIVSVGMARLTGFGSNINVIATDERCRNRGYATSIVSALVKEIFKTSETALIHVIENNASAVRAYTKVGFKPYRAYLSIRT